MQTALSCAPGPRAAPAKQHGHGIATMLRACAAALQTRRALTTRPARTSESCANRLFRLGERAGSSDEEELAGVAGFEPTNGGIKTRCLTTWRHPNT